jgi:large subunit ribosomal protein L4
MKMDVYNIKGEQIGSIELDDKIFNVDLNRDLLHQVMRFLMLQKKFPVSHAKDRSEVSGGGRKPWKQKGTGRARHGSSRSPIWRKGGATFGPLSINNYQVSINKKMKRKALFMVLSEAVRENELKLVDALAFDKISSKEGSKALSVLVPDYVEGKEKVMVVVSAKDEVVEKSFRNLEKVVVLRADSLNVEDLLKSSKIILDARALDVINKTFRV